MNTIKKLTKAREASSLLFLVILFAIVGCINSDFLAPSSIMACFNDSVVFTLLAVGMAFAIFIGEIDVSIGSNLGFSAAVVGSMLRDGCNPILACGQSDCVLCGSDCGCGGDTYTSDKDEER